MRTASWKSRFDVISLTARMSFFCSSRIRLKFQSAHDALRVELDRLRGNDVCGRGRTFFKDSSEVVVRIRVRQVELDRPLLVSRRRRRP